MQCITVRKIQVYITELYQTTANQSTYKLMQKFKFSRALLYESASITAHIIISYDLHITISAKKILVTIALGLP